MVLFHTVFHMSACNRSLLIANRRTATENGCMAAMWLFLSLQKTWLRKLHFRSIAMSYFSARN
jgi:hypothetical protein